MSWQNRRMEIVRKLTNTLRKLREDGYDIESVEVRESLITEMSIEYGAARRTAIEYLNDAVAIVRKEIKLKKEREQDIEGQIEEMKEIDKILKNEQGTEREIT